MSDMQSMSVETNLNGYFRSDYTSREKTIIDVTGGFTTEGVLPPIKSTVRDARNLQDSENDLKPDFESRFFDRHGFVMLPHESQVQNWDSGAFGQSDTIQIGNRDLVQPTGENEIEKYYMKEVEELIRNFLLPGKTLFIQQPNMVLRRGTNTAHPFYGSGVHNDYGVTADDFESNAAAFGTPEQGQQWREQYERDDVRAFMMINFWRPVHMSCPVEHMPLAVLDASSVDSDDLVLSGLKGFTLTGKVSTQLSLRHNSSQAWYYYPRMTVNEVMALKLFHIDKNTSNLPFGACYHSAFENPLAPEDAEERQSCEHRVSVFILRD